MITILEYQGEWYQLGDAKLRVAPFRVFRLFDVVIEIEDNEYNVIKNRYTSITGKDALSDLMKVKMWVAHQKYKDLPLFINDFNTTNYPLQLAKDKDGNLVAVPTVDEFDPRS